jgi:hypothetical protein
MSRPQPVGNGKTLTGLLVSTWPAASETVIVWAPIVRRMTRPKFFAPRSAVANVYGVGRNASGSLLEKLTVPV